MEQKQTCDLMLIGPVTRDINVDYTEQTVREIGGAVYFCSFPAAIAGADIHVAVKMNPADRDVLEAFELPPEQISVLPDAHTTLMHNKYFTADRERRIGTCLEQSGTIEPTDIPPVSARLYHLAGLLYGDFHPDLIKSLAQKGKVSIDAQGFLRHNEDGHMNFHDWADKLKQLPYLDFLKVDAAEAEILTGCSDRRAAAEQLYAWGAKEILISHNSEILVYDGACHRTCPITAGNLSGRTGRGDTTMGAYLAKRVTGADIDQALKFATAAVSIKMETPGPLRKTHDEILAYMNRHQA